MEEAVRRIIQSGCGCGEDTGRQGLLDTPKRVAHAWMAMAAADKAHKDKKGCQVNASDLIKNALFHEEILTTSPHCGFVLVRDMTFACLHKDTLLPMYGKCHVAYIPKNGTIVGLSKLSRVVSNVSVRGLQRGDDLCAAVLEVVDSTVDCNGGVAVLIDAWEYTKYLDPSLNMKVNHHHQKRHTYCKRTGAFADEASCAIDEVQAMLGLVVPSTPSEGSMINHEEMELEYDSMRSKNSKDLIASAVGILLESIGEDPTTAQSRASAANYASWFLDSTRGYFMNAAPRTTILNSIKADDQIGDGNHGESVLGIPTEVSSATSADDALGHYAVKTFAFTSQCEHHLLPFSGHFAVMFLNSSSPIDSATMDSVDRECTYQVDRFSKRLQVQERLTQQVADAFWQGILRLELVTEIEDIVVVCECKHMCMIARGVQQHCSATTTYTTRSADGISMTGQAKVKALHVLREELSDCML
jgi:GTP cyclohydrolase I